MSLRGESFFGACGRATEGGVRIEPRDANCVQKAWHLSENVFEISMLPQVNERDPDPHRNSGDSQRARYCSAQPQEVRNSTPAHTSPSVLFTSPHP